MTKRKLLLFLGVAAMIVAAPNLSSAQDCTGPDGYEGTILYNKDVKTLQFCDGANWVAVSSGQNTCPVGGHGTGYFVLTANTYTGDLEQESIDAGLGGGKGPAAGDLLCLKDLTDNDWMGKADAQARGLLDASHVKAFMESNNASANTEYFFAVAGDPTKGGASFTTDENGLGPGNNADWSGASYFDGAKQYWSNRNTVSDSLWADNGSGATNVRCGVWNKTNGTGDTGISNTTDQNRFNASTASCSTQLHLVCFVHP